MKHGRIFLCLFACLLGAILASPTFAAAQTKDDDDVDHRPPCRHAHAHETVTVGEYVFRAYESADGSYDPCVLITLHGQLVRRLAKPGMEGYHLGQHADPENKIAFLANGSDLTGEGHPDMMVRSWSGGMHCCFVNYIFELEPKLRLIAMLDDGDNALGHFEDLDHNQHYFYVTTEIWSYWPRSFASSVQHKVILRWNGKRFALALDRMQAPPPTPRQWRAAVKAVDDELKDGADPDGLGDALWQPTLNLIYEGHPDLAWKFVREVNPKALHQPDITLSDFCSMLKASQYWPDIKPTLQNMPETCAKAEGPTKK